MPSLASPLVRQNATPNPSFEARPNGKPPGPGRWYAYIFTDPGLASCRRSRFNSNVRPRETCRAVLPQNQRLSAWTEQPRRAQPPICRRPSSARHIRSAQRDCEERGGTAQETNRGRKNAGTPQEDNAWEPQRYIGAPRCVGGHRLQLLRWVRHWCVCGQSRVAMVRMHAAPPSPPRSRKAPETTKPSQVQAVARRARPNPSFEARPNGVAPGPRSRKAYHRPRGPGATPLVPPQLER